MPHFDDVATLQRVLPGRWIVKATNLPSWLSGERRDATFEYATLRDEPFTLVCDARMAEPDGKPRSVRSVSRWNGVGFTSRTKGIGGALTKSRWEVAGVRQGIVVLRFERSLRTPAGVEVLVGESVDATELRSVIAADPSSFGLSLEEFASLTWLDHLPAR